MTGRVEATDLELTTSCRCCFSIALVTDCDGSTSPSSWAEYAIIDKSGRTLGVIVSRMPNLHCDILSSGPYVNEL
jgi:hypothetical protein